MKRFILCFSFLIVGICAFNFGEDVSAQALTDSSQLFQSTGGVSLSGDLPDYTGGATNNEGQFRAITNLLVKWLKRLMMPVAIVFLTWGGVKLIVSRGDEEQALTQRKNESFAIAAGFLLFLIAEVAVNKVFFGYSETDRTFSGAILRGGEEGRISTFAKQGWIQMEGLFDFVTSFIVAVATLYIIVTCVRMLLSFGSEDAMAELKSRLLYSVLGLALVISIKQIVLLFTGVKYGALDNPDTSGLLKFFIQWANVILGFLGILAVAALVWAGVILIAGFGDESRRETAKKIVMYVIIGLVLAFSAWTIVYYFSNAGNV